MAGWWVVRVALAFGLVASVRFAPAPPPQSAPDPGATTQPTPTTATNSAASTTAPETSATASPRILLRDDFSDPTSGWPRQSETPASRRLGYENGEYLIARIAGSGSSPFVSTAVRFDDCQIEIDARLSPPAEGAYVYLDFRRQSNSDRFSFVVNPGNGTFLLRRYHGQRGSDLVPWTRAAAINGGTSPNRLGARVTGSEIILLLNGQEIGRTRDDTLLEGQVAFGVGHFQDGPAEAHFGSLIVTSVP
jgi:hypothetical protein